MNDHQWLGHELNVLLHKYCDCQECTDGRSLRLMQDLNLMYDCTTIEQVEARRRLYGR
jgi:hypothetical protein